MREGNAMGRLRCQQQSATEPLWQSHPSHFAIAGSQVWLSASDFQPSPASLIHAE
jgi:hypothetical protein